jgi:hypothetical protein
MDLGKEHFAGIRDVEINKQKRKPKVDVPHGVTAITEHGLRIPCDVHYDGTERTGPFTVLPCYRIKAELDWRNIKLTRIEIENWPDNIVMVLDFGGEPGDVPPEWVSQVEWVEIVKRP